MKIQDIMKSLAKNGVYTSMHYNAEKDQFYVDLETRAKSALHLYEDGVLRGRYNYENRIDLSKDVEAIIKELCHEFNRALHGRDYYQHGWGALCELNGIAIKTFF